MARVSVFLDTPDGQRLLQPGKHVIGRADDVNIVLRSSRASRRHAEIVVTPEGATIEDLKSANGTYVNGNIIKEKKTLKAGDFIVIGDLGLDVSMEEERETSGPPVSAAPPPPPRRRPPPPPRRTGQESFLDEPGHPSTTRVNAREVLVAVAERALAQGQPEQAERVLERWLVRALDDARANRIDPEMCEPSINLSLAIGVGIRSRRWINHCFDLLTAMRMPIGPELAKKIVAAISQVRPDDTALATYEAMLRSSSQSDEMTQTLKLVTRWRAALASSP
jgi:hypothetical protein